MKKMLSRLFDLKAGTVIMRAAYVCVTLLLILFFAKGFSQSKFDLTFYQIKGSRIEQNIRIVNISDLHMKQFGKDNYRLVEQIRNLKPDIIAVVGDLTIQGNADYSTATSLLAQLTDIAPVYYSYGNHEYSEVLKGDSNIIKDIKGTGVHLVNNSYETVNVNGSVLSIGGFCAAPKTFHDNADKFMQKFMKADGYKILLCHYVECFEEVMEPYPVDLAFTGHAHGGQIRLPLIGGVYAPDQGLFPRLTEGIHDLCGSQVIINRGLGNSHFMPRFYNNPEIVIADINWY